MAAVSGLAVAQYRGGRRRRRFGGLQLPSTARGVPNWKNDERFKHDVFTFVRVAVRLGRGNGLAAWLWRHGPAAYRRRAAVAGSAADGAAAGPPTGPTAT